MAMLGSIQWLPLAKGEVNPGDTVSADAGGMPIYRVVAVDDGQAWIQDDRHPAPWKAPLDLFHWRAAPAHP